MLEFIEGCTLNERLNQSPDVSTEQCRHWMKQLADTIRLIHERGVIHGDLRLDNLLIDSQENLRITDFGLSQLANQTLQKNQRVDLDAIELIRQRLMMANKNQ